MEFLDALRGVAVALVVLQHVAQHASVGFRHFSTAHLQLGQLGVMVFFLCSGFIIPASLERNGSLATFWVSRFFRLYPLYWLSLLAALVLAVAGRHVVPGLRPLDWVVNATMLQAFLGSPDAIGVYWTLAFEMAFYLSVSVLFLLAWHRRSVLLALLAAAVCLTAALGFRLLLDRGAPLGLFCLVTMFTGTVVHRVRAGTVRRGVAAGCVAFSLLAGMVLLWTTLHGHEDPSKLGARSVVPMASAWVGAYLVFGAGLAAWGRKAPGPLQWLGKISYSVYLMQGIVYVGVPAVHSRWLTALAWVVVTVLASAVTYEVVERHAIAAGRRVVRRLVARAQAQNPEAAPRVSA